MGGGCSGPTKGEEDEKKKLQEEVGFGRIDMSENPEENEPNHSTNVINQGEGAENENAGVNGTNMPSNTSNQGAENGSLVCEIENPELEGEKSVGPGKRNFGTSGSHLDCEEEEKTTSRMNNDQTSPQKKDQEKNPLEDLFRRFPEFQIGQYYDVCALVRSIGTGVRDMWPVRVFGKSEPDEYHTIGIVGNSDEGKTWVLSQLAGCWIPSGSCVSTPGLCMKYEKIGGIQCGLLDTQGCEAAIQAIFKGKNGEARLKFMEEEVQTQLRDEEFCFRAVLTMSETLIVVVTKLSPSVQLRIIEGVIALLQECEKKTQNMVVIHNFRNCTTKEEFEKQMKKRGLSIGPFQKREQDDYDFLMISEERPPPANSKGQKVYVEHYFLADHNSEFGRKNNEAVFKAIRSSVKGRCERKKLPFIENLRLVSEQELREMMFNLKDVVFVPGSEPGGLQVKLECRGTGNVSGAPPMIEWKTGPGHLLSGSRRGLCIANDVIDCKEKYVYIIDCDTPGLRRLNIRHIGNEVHDKRKEVEKIMNNVVDTKTCILSKNKKIVMSKADIPLKEYKEEFPRVGELYCCYYLDNKAREVTFYFKRTTLSEDQKAYCPRKTKCSGEVTLTAIIPRYVDFTQELFENMCVKNGQMQIILPYTNSKIQDMAEKKLKEKTELLMRSLSRNKDEKKEDDDDDDDDEYYYSSEEEEEEIEKDDEDAIVSESPLSKIKFRREDDD